MKYNRKSAWVKFRFARTAAVCVAAVFSFWPGLVCSQSSYHFSPRSPFVGDLSESFEAFPNFLNGGTYKTLPIMQGGAFIDDPMLQPGRIDYLEFHIYEPSAGAHIIWPQIGDVPVADGTKALGFPAGSTGTIHFTSPVSDFGAFWGTDTEEGAQIRFYDVIGRQIYDDDISPTGGFVWKGWHSDLGIAKVEFESFYTAIDGLQAIQIPEPSATILMGVGSVLLAWRVGSRKCRIL